ncbi:MAG: hypothetical protein GF383_16115 [Candidatus Lokiarchaeota archaeon]|nr:hypothetical protein [Candidatus Lokiarchaeota archaeon]MBD3343257.1 hypothetical protein [Candidatus Lokiarchaeota archaeon]
MHEDDKIFLIVHGIFSLVCMLILFLPLNIKIGIKLFILVLIYNIIIPIVGVWKKDRNWLNIWLFSFILSLFQIWPDWFLSAQLNILIFPEDGLFKIGTVSGYMLFLWAIPFFIILYVGKRIETDYSERIVYSCVALLSLLIFGTSEMTIWTIGSWYAQNVFTIGHIAVYIIVPEILLGLSTNYFYKTIEKKSHYYKIIAAFFVMLIYLGSAVFFFFLIEKIVF